MSFASDHYVALYTHEYYQLSIVIGGVSLRSLPCSAKLGKLFAHYHFFLLQRTSTLWCVLTPKPVAPLLSALRVINECILIKKTISIVPSYFFFHVARTALYLLYSLFMFFGLFRIKSFLNRFGQLSGIATVYYHLTEWNWTLQYVALIKRLT